MVSFRQIKSFVAVYEEGSFTAAAEREGATQSGVSQHVKQLEDMLGAALFLRDGRSVEATSAGRSYYEDCVGVLKRLDAATRRIGREHESVGEVRVGLMPSFTRGVLPPALERFLEASPGTEVRVTEAYSGVLTDMVRRGELDFAIVPGFAGAVGLTMTLLLRDREMLVTRKGSGLHMRPVCLAALEPLKIVLPGRQNTRRNNLETYFSTNGVAIGQRLELDAMMGTLEFVRTTNWVTVLPSVIMVGDFGGERFDIRPLDAPVLNSDFVLIEPSRKAMSRAARLFADLLQSESERAAGASGVTADAV
jgi:LysR family nitrogen assimilation transcriptional regulator